MNSIESRAEEFRAVLASGTVATNVFLRKLHNFALDMNWLLGPVLVKPQWPKRDASKRAITGTEHERICRRETNPGTAGILRTVLASGRLAVRRRQPERREHQLERAGDRLSSTQERGACGDPDRRTIGGGPAVASLVRAPVPESARGSVG